MADASIPGMSLATPADADSLPLVRSSTGVLDRRVSIAKLKETFSDGAELTGLTTVSNNTSITSGAYFGTDIQTSDLHASGTTGIVLAAKSTVNNFGTGNTSGAGHYVGHWGGFYNQPAGTPTVSLAIGLEGTGSHKNGTITEGVGVLGTLNENAVGATFNGYRAVKGSIANNSGTIVDAVGVMSEIANNAGAITKFTGYRMPDLSAISGITTKRFLESLDPNAPSQVAAPICDSSQQLVAGSNGGTTATANNTGTVAINTGGTIASHTITLPSSPLPGQKVVYTVIGTITALTVSGPGTTVLQAPTTMTDNSFVMRFWKDGLGAGNDLWLRGL